MGHLKVRASCLMFHSSCAMPLGSIQLQPNWRLHKYSLSAQFLPFLRLPLLAKVCTVYKFCKFYPCHSAFYAACWFFMALDACCSLAQNKQIKAHKLQLFVVYKFRFISVMFFFCSQFIGRVEISQMLPKGNSSPGLFMKFWNRFGNAASGPPTRK